ncbi:MAG: hypothetical protein JWL59_2113 [Chthoniobacteraceae bacterium]|nr:hypothetical protein [Chthoniobacteraceae bacterium]
MTPAEIRLFIKKETRLYKALGNIFGVRDALGNLLGPFILDQTPKISEATFKTLSDVADAKFWGPYMFSSKPLPDKEEK